MEATEKRLVIILADISGYTKFMVENQMSAIHGQQVITSLIETMLREVDIPLRLQEIEGDALFLYAEDPGHDDQWEDVLNQVRVKLSRFFDAFYEGIVVAMDATPCKCAICTNATDLSLKIVVHSGTAVFHKIGQFDQISGPDVILAHRLLKNSVTSAEYLLMTEAAYASIGKNMDGRFTKGRETYDRFGTIGTYMQPMGEVKKRHHDSLYEGSRTEIVLRAGSYTAIGMRDTFRALFKHVRQPMTDVGWVRRTGFAIVLIVAAPIIGIFSLISAPHRLLTNRAHRANAKPRQADST